jgi:hypothetical protein
VVFMNDALTASDDPFVKLKPLVGVAAAEIDASFDGLTGGLQGAAFPCTVRVTLLSGEQEQHGTISVRDGNAQRAVEGDAVDIEVITSPETWLAIASGQLAPLDAFTGGKMRVRGDYKLARRIMLHLAAGPGRTDFC